ncbi:MAG: hypothetical protein AAF495_27805 [Pseudomonadota bacterium]
MRRLVKPGPLMWAQMSSAQPSALASQASAQVGKVGEIGTQLSFCWLIAIVVKSGSFWASAGAAAVPIMIKEQAKQAGTKAIYRLLKLFVFSSPRRRNQQDHGSMMLRLT